MEIVRLSGQLRRTARAQADQRRRFASAGMATGSLVRRRKGCSATQLQRSWRAEASVRVLTSTEPTLSMRVDKLVAAPLSKSQWMKHMQLCSVSPLREQWT